MSDPGYGPPPGNPTGPARGGGIPFDDLARTYRITNPTSGSPLADWSEAVRNPLLQGTVDVTRETTKAQAKSVAADIPLVAIQNTWSVQDAQSAVYAHLIGLFFSSAMLCESMMGDDRITACLNTKRTALFGKPARFKPANDSAAAKKCCEAWAAWWPQLSADASMPLMSDYATMMGFSHSQILWRQGVLGLPFGAPVLRPWFPQFEYYDWTWRRYMAMCDRQPVLPIIPGSGKWLEFTPFGSYRGWIRGALRACAEAWLLRHFGFRDMARFGEVHGNPTRLGRVPAASDPTERSNFETSLANLGSDTAMIVPQGVDQGLGYDYELVEAQGKAWEVHPAQIDRCDMAIVLAILMVNLTTEVDGGSYGAAKVHMDKEHGGTEFDESAWAFATYRDLARPFAWLNYGDPDLAPWTYRDLTTDAARERNAKQFQAVATAFQASTTAGIRFTNPDEVREWMGTTFGLGNVPSFTLTEPKVSGEGFGGGAAPFGKEPAK